MTIRFDDDVPPDILIKQAVDRAILAGLALPRWGWPVPRAYNGFLGAERIAGWQRLRIAERLGLIAFGPQCAICKEAIASQKHVEIYSRWATVIPVCRSCHFHIHRRFVDPSGWQNLLHRCRTEIRWANALGTTELSRAEADIIAEKPDVLAALAARNLLEQFGRPDT